ncbi:MAG: prepilin-type N-terminal cleavage/methylation domain-containing protein [Sulfuricellaceae bacterium]
MIQRNHKSQAGFTLLELIIAMTLAALVVALGASILRMGVDFYHRSHEYIHQQQEMHGFLKLMRDELQGATKGSLALSGDATQLSFTTDNMPIGIGRGGQNKAMLECRPNAQGQIELIHRIQVKKAPDDAGAAPPKPTTPEYEEEALVHKLTQCAFSFLLRGEKESASKAAWIDDWLERKDAPLAVRIQLTQAAGSLPPVVIPLE